MTGGGTNAGSHTATASISGGQANATNYTLANTTQPFTITQREAGLSWSGHENLTYTGSPVHVTATATGLVGGDRCAVTVTGGTGSGAGTYTAKASGLDNPNYKLPAANTQSYTIAKAPVSFTMADNTYDYDVSAKSATVIQTAGEAPSAAGQFSVTYKQNGSAVSAPTAVGGYEIWVALDSENFKFAGEEDTIRSKQVGTLTISGADYPDRDSISWPTAGGLTYGTAPADSALTGGGSTGAGGGGTFAWKDPETIPTVSNEGYTVVFTPDDANYSTVEHSVTITVNPKELTVSGAAAQSRDYMPGNTAVTVSGGALEGVVTRNGTPDDVTLNMEAAAGTVETPDAGDSRPVTVTGCALAGADVGNYTLRQPTGLTADIAPAAGAASVSVEDWVYGGAANSPVLAATNGTGNVTYRYAGTKLDESGYDSENIPTDAGDYTVTAVFAAAPNYRESTATADFAIKPKPITVQ